MAFEMSLVELLSLAERGIKGDESSRRAATEAASKLIRCADLDVVPKAEVFEDYAISLIFGPSIHAWDHPGLPFADYVRSLDAGRRTIPSGLEFIFDTHSHFFVSHGGYDTQAGLVERAPAGLIHQLATYTVDLQLVNPKRTVLHNQPRDDIVSVVIGSVIKWDSARKQETRGDAYIYIENGKNRRPGGVARIDGTKPLSELRPVLYFSTESTGEFGEWVHLLVPKTHLVSP